MKRLGFCVALLSIAASMLSAQAPGIRPVHAPAHRAAPSLQPPETFKKYCFECHGGEKHRGDVSIERLIQQSAQSSIGDYWDLWDKVAEKLETKEMPPEDKAELFPTDAERTAATAWIRSSLGKYSAEHAGEPGRVTVRRLTSAEYAYAIRDLTGIDIKVGIDASSDSVGGEGFTNFGDVQFVQDASIERYLEAAKLVADHAVIGAGPLEFYADTGKTGLELSALNRINELYATKGFRVVSGEGGRPFGLERYGKAFYVAWYYKHRVALGDPTATLRGLAAKEGITGRFAEHIWTVVNKPNTGYPTRETVDGWNEACPAPDLRRQRVDREGARRLRRPLQSADDVAELVLRARRSRRRAAPATRARWCSTTRRSRPSRRITTPTRWALVAAADAALRSHRGPAKVYLTFTDVNPDIGRDAGGDLAQPARRHACRATAGSGAPGAAGAAAATGAGRGRGAAGPILSTVPLRAILPADAAATLAFGTSTGRNARSAPTISRRPAPVSFTIDVPARRQRPGVSGRMPNSARTGTPSSA